MWDVGSRQTSVSLTPSQTESRHSSQADLGLRDPVQTGAVSVANGYLERWWRYGIITTISDLVLGPGFR